MEGALFPIRPIARLVSLDEGIEEAVRVIRRGGVIAFPTDTVYGIGADAHNAGALRHLRAIKGRDADKPIPLLLSEAGMLERVCDALPPIAVRLAADFFPGALTLVVPLSATFPRELNLGRTTVGVRVPNHAGMRRLLEACGGLLAATSANRSGEPPATAAEEVLTTLGKQVELILDGGRTPGQIPSTVLDTTTTPPMVLREGAISLETLAPYMDFTT